MFPYNATVFPKKQGKPRLFHGIMAMSAYSFTFLKKCVTLSPYSTSYRVKRNALARENNMEQNDRFAQIYRATKDPLLRYLVPRVRAAADVEDLLQEIYRKLLGRLYRGDVRDPLAYLYGIAKKELARFYRGKAQMLAFEQPLSDTIPDDAPPPDETALSLALTDTVWAVVRTEPLPSYQAFVLYYGFELTTPEIAKELHMTEEAVRKRLERTRNKVRRALNVPADVKERKKS